MTLQPIIEFRHTTFESYPLFWAQQTRSGIDNRFGPGKQGFAGDKIQILGVLKILE